MNPLVKLVNEWDVYSQQHSNATIDDFCRYYLVNAHTGRTVNQASCPEDHSRLIKTMGILMAGFNLYFKAAMAESTFPFPEAFYFLNVLKQQGAMKKTALINILQLEYTTGMEGIRKLTEAGLVIEENDETDRRAKKIRLSQKGEALLPEGYAYMGKIGKMLFGTMTDEAIKLCLQLLEDVVDQQTKLVREVKDMGFQQMHTLIRGAESTAKENKGAD